MDLQCIHPGNYLPIWASRMNLLENGKYKEKLSLLKQKVDTEGTSIHNWRKIKSFLSSMREYPVKNKNLIYNDKSNFSKKNFPIMKSLQTSGLDSISKERVLSEYWNSSSQEISKRLWLPTKTDCQDLDMSSLNLSFNNTEPFSQCVKIHQSKELINSHKTSFRSLQFTRPNITDQESIRYCKKIRIYPSVAQLQLFNKCLGANRYFYNQANNFIKTEYAKTKKVVLSRTKIRDAVITPDKKLSPENIWQKEIPYDTRQLAIDQVIEAYKSNFELNKNREDKRFDVKYKSKKARNEIFKIEKRAINFEKLRIFSRRTVDSFRIRSRDIEKIKEECDGTITCLKTKPGRWYLCLPRTKLSKDKPIYESASYKSVFIDPGVRTFMTFYSPDGIAGKIGDNFAKKYFNPIVDKVEKLESVRSKVTGWRTRRNIKNKLLNLRNKLKNITSDLHWKSCNFLTNTFDTIFLPDFRSSEMVQNIPGRIIGKKTVKQMLELSHCEFRKKLIYSAKIKQRELVLINEEYTTKTCGSCGVINNVNGSRIYRCKCGYSMDRDLHGSRNICIKIMS